MIYFFLFSLVTQQMVNTLSKMFDASNLQFSRFGCFANLKGMTTRVEIITNLSQRPFPSLLGQDVKM